MSFYNFLTTRHSNGHLQAPAPNQFELDSILQSAMTVPDHGGLLPFRCTVIQGEALDKLTQVFVDAIKANTNDECKLAKAAKMAYRAPLIIMVSTNYKEHPKVPFNEQLITAGCAVYAMQMACVSLGFQGMWRTGDVCTSGILKEKLNVSDNNDVVGFLYIGTESKILPAKKRKHFSQVTEFL